MRRLAFGVVVAAIAACNNPDASTLTHPPRRASYPLYVTFPGTVLGEGAIYKIAAPEELDAASAPEPVLSGLDFPAAIAVTREGEVYYTDRPGGSGGRIMQLGGEGEPSVEIATGLLDPQGLALDRSGKMYVAEHGAGRVSRVSFATGELETIADGLSGPRSLSTDEQDNLYVAETTRGAVVKIIPDGTRSDLATGLRGAVAVGPGLVGNTFYLAANEGMGDGAVGKIVVGGAPEAYLDRLINPTAFAWEDSTVLFVAEAAPARRVISFSRVTNQRVEVASLPGDPHSMAFKPLN